MNILSIDPGYEQSAYVIYNGWLIIDKAKIPNGELLGLIKNVLGPEALVIEQIACMGMAVGEEVLETVFWTGRFREAWERQFDRIKRHEIKMHLCRSMRATDANIRQALIDRFGPGKDKAIGTKKAPGPLYGVKADIWAALAVAVTWHDKNCSKVEAA